MHYTRATRLFTEVEHNGILPEHIYLGFHTFLQKEEDKQMVVDILTERADGM